MERLEKYFLLNMYFYFSIMVFIEKNKRAMTFSNALRQNERQVMCIEKNLLK